MIRPKTLLEVAGLTASMPSLSRCALVIIDAQREYLDGDLPLAGASEAIAEIQRLLHRARQLGTPVLHVAHHGKAGAALFDPGRPGAEIVGALRPAEGEAVVIKRMPSAFAGTDLEERLRALERSPIIFVGFATHLCLSTSVRDALHRGLQSVVVAAACATRDLPDGREGVIAAPALHRAHLAALADRFALVVETAAEIVD